MRVLMINKRAPFTGRGAEYVLWQVAQELAHRGDQVTVFCPAPAEDVPVPFVDNVNFEFVDIDGSPTRKMIEFFLRGTGRYRELYRRVQPDVVYDNPSPFPFHAAHVYGDAPVVTKVHAIYRSYAFECKQHPLVKLGTILGEETYRLFRGEQFITNSESTAERLESLVDTDRNSIVANPVGIDASEFDFHIPDDSKRVVTVSKLSPRKRVSDLLRAWESVEAEHADATLTVAGSGPREGRLRALADELELERVTFVGYVSESKKKELLHEAAVFVSPTLFEGFGLSNLEAMASGCAVVSTDTWGVKDYLMDGENGVVVSPKSTTQLFHAIDRLLREPEARSSIASASRSTPMEYSIRSFVDRELEFVKKVVS